MPWGSKRHYKEKMRRVPSIRGEALLLSHACTHPNHTIQMKLHIIKGSSLCPKTFLVVLSVVFQPLNFTPPHFLQKKTKNVTLSPLTQSIFRILQTVNPLWWSTRCHESISDEKLSMDKAFQ